MLISSLFIYRGIKILFYRIMDINKILNKYKTDIEQLCKALCRNWKCPKIELEDLIQEANIKLWQLSKNKDFDINDKSKILIAIKNRLIDYKRVFERNPLSGAESLEEILYKSVS